MTKFANIDLATNITVEEQHIVALVQFLRSIQSLRIVPTQEDDTDCEPLDLSRFEGLNSLRIDRCDIRLVQGLSRISSGLRHFACVRVAPKGLAISLEDILVLALQDQYMDTLSLDADIIQRVALQWPLLVRLECVDCGLEAIDESVLGLKSVQVLNFSKNRLKKVPNLQTLPQLQALDLSHNQISDVRDVATMVGNVAQLTLRHNALQNLNGLHRLYSVEKLDLGENKISKLSDVRQLRRLELLHELWLDGNPVSRMSNFRHLTAAMFEVRLYGGFRRLPRHLVHTFSPLVSHTCHLLHLLLFYTSTIYSIFYFYTHSSELSPSLAELLYVCLPTISFSSYFFFLPSSYSL
eukprot:Rmarinus@m.14392